MPNPQETKILGINRQWNLTRKLKCFNLFWRWDDFTEYGHHMLIFPLWTFHLFVASFQQAAPVYGVYISQLIRYSRACGSFQDFLDRRLLLTSKLLNQWFLLVKLKSSLRRSYGHHHDLVNRYGISVSQMTMDVFLPERLSSPPVFSGVPVTRSLVLCVCFVDRCLSFCTFSFGHCVVCSSSIYWLITPLVSSNSSYLLYVKYPWQMSLNVYYVLPC